MTLTLLKNILKRGNSFSVRFDVPMHTQSVVGKKQIVRSLGTSDIGEALVKQDVVIREIRESLYGEPRPKLGKPSPARPPQESTATVRPSC